MNALLAQFVSEARDLLQEAGEDLLALERTPDNEDAINRLFRSVHTLKGSSGLFNALALTQVLHAGEDMFQAVREHGLPLTANMVDLTLKALDQVGLWIEYLGQHEEMPSDAPPIAKELVAEIRSRFGRRPGEPLGEPLPAAAAESNPSLPVRTRWFSEDVLIEAASVIDAGTVLYLVSYTPDDGCFFKGEDPLHVAVQIPNLQALTAEVRAPWPALGGFDPFMCNLAFHALSTADRDDIDTLFRYVPEQVTVTQLAAEMLVNHAGDDTLDLPSDLVGTLLREQLALLAIPAAAEEFDGRVAVAARVAANVLRFGRREDTGHLLRAACLEAQAARQTEPLRAAIAEFLAAGAPAEPPVAQRNAAAGEAEQTMRPVQGEQHDRVVPKTLKVDQEKVDALMNLIGELVVAKNSLPFLARRAEQQFGMHELGREIKDQYGVMDRIAQELQSAVLAVRMMPVGQVFQRFPRLVRDLSRKLGKEVDLVVEGEETEADKNVIETLFDPLLHMVRNSLDHGIELPAERRACGKPDAATVRLLARHDGDQVVIEVVDDGRGIDPEVIKKKAFERGMLDEARMASISDEDATMLVFAAGFSTAATVSELSGRGVGMDVVRNVVERAGGRIAMTSAKGRGTTVRLNLPLSMAVSRVMTVGLDDRLFGIPMDLIHETVKLPRSDVVRIRGREAFVLRDRVVPLVHLAQLLDLPDATVAADEVAVLVVRVSGQTIGLGISAFGEGMEVILKPLEGMMAKIVGYTGTALLGDGRVLLVLDLKELIQ